MKRARTVTGSVAEISAPKVKHTMKGMACVSFKDPNIQRHIPVTKVDTKVPRNAKVQIAPKLPKNGLVFRLQPDSVSVIC